MTVNSHHDNSHHHHFSFESVEQPDFLPDVGNFQPISKRKLSTTSLGLGFDPTGLNPESGFRPIVKGQGSSIPTLAFSVLDGADRPPVSAQLYEQEEILQHPYPESIHSLEYEVMLPRDKDFLL